MKPKNVNTNTNANTSASTSANGHNNTCNSTGASININVNTNTNNNSTEYISGTVERITYHNIDNGFCVLRTIVKGRKDLVTVIGNVPAISVGEHITCSGTWHNDRNHGLQFKASFLKALPPNSLEGIEKYLGSGLIRGIGPHFAKKLVKKFGMDVFDVIENEPELLRTVENIGKVRAANICANWKEQKIVREIMVFLQSHGVGTARATRIYKTYGDKAIEIVSDNPYKLASDIRGIGFISADVIAGNLGIAKNSLIRARAGVNHALLEATSEGHCGLPERLLVQNAQKLLEIDESLVEEAITKEIEIGSLTKDTLQVFGNNVGTKANITTNMIPDNVKKTKTSTVVNSGVDMVGTDTIFLTSYYVYEKNSGQMLLNMRQGEVPWEDINIAVATGWVEKKLNMQLAEVQKIALEKALQTKVMVITGGPGTGKTTLVNSILTILRAKQLKIKLCAPTGRAARRLNESTGLEAITIHRLLEIDPIKGGFKRNKNNKLECDYLVIDEVSMVDVQLLHSLLQAIPQNAALLLVGDVDQLPSVGAGQVLKDIIDSGAITTVKLTEIFRQAATSDIITNAHLINHGRLPNLVVRRSDSENPKEVSAKEEEKQKLEKAQEKASTKEKIPKTSDFYFIAAEPGEDIMKKLIELVTHRIPARFGFRPVHDIQLLTPMQRGGVGARSLNIELQKVLNPTYEAGIVKFGEHFAKNDKIMQTENNYDKEVYNGDIGEIKSINEQEQEVTITFYGRDVVYDYTDLDQITLAYATTIHKSQGSEYPVVIIPLTMQSFRMLQRNLVYTAITRGKKLVIIIGQKKALAIAVKNTRSLWRYSKLREWLCTAA